MSPDLTRLNAASGPHALAMMAPLVECSPWVPEAVLDRRPFASDEALAEALVEAILAATPQRRVALFRAHPALAGRTAAGDPMTRESINEQARLGLGTLPPRDLERLAALNARYSRRFGHPFIVALHRVPDLEALFATFARRLEATPLEEHTTTLAEIASVIRARCRRLFGPGAGECPLPQTATQE